MYENKFQVLAGDFGEGEIECVGPDLRFSKRNARGTGELLDSKDVHSLDIASEESFKKTGGAIGWGLAGAAFFGPVGLLAGLVLGGKKKEVTFIMVFSDGRKLLGKADEKIFNTLRVATFK